MKKKTTQICFKKSNRPLPTTSIPSPTAEVNILFLLVNVRPSWTEMLRSHVMNSLILMGFIELRWQHVHWNHLYLYTHFLSLIVLSVFLVCLLIIYEAQNNTLKPLFHDSLVFDNFSWLPLYKIASVFLPPLSALPTQLLWSIHLFLYCQDILVGLPGVIIFSRI